MSENSGCGTVAATCALLFVVFIAYSGYANHRGESAAHSLCDTINVGDSLASVRAKMNAVSGSLRGVHEVHEPKDPFFRDNPDFIYVEFSAAWVERYSCVADLDHSVVKRVRVEHLD